MLKISNGILSAEIDPNGAELSSLINNKTGKEYIWQADPAIWNRHAPILFPCVGRVRNDSYIYNDKIYYIQKHGFARNMLFSIIAVSETSVILRLKSDDSTRLVFPFDFELDVAYKLKDNKLIVEVSVRNLNENQMYFSLGYHPGFNCEIGDKLIFSCKETMKVPYLNGSDVSENPDDILYFKDQKELVLTKELFERGSLALEKPKSKSVSIAKPDGTVYVTEKFGKINMLWLWAKPGENFVCIEPWNGSDERFECDILNKKKDIVELDFNETHKLSVEICI